MLELANWCMDLCEVSIVQDFVIDQSWYLIAQLRVSQETGRFGCKNISLMTANRIRRGRRLQFSASLHRQPHPTDTIRRCTYTADVSDNEVAAKAVTKGSPPARRRSPGLGSTLVDW